jgi:hypothetical protein
MIGHKFFVCLPVSLISHAHSLPYLSDWPVRRTLS